MPTTGEITIRMWDVRLVVRKERGKNGGAQKTKLGTTPKNIKNRGEKKRGPRVDRLLGVDREGGDKKERRQKKKTKTI